MKKKSLAIMLAALLAMSAAGCAGQKQEAAPAAPAAAETAETTEETTEEAAEPAEAAETGEAAEAEEAQTDNSLETLFADVADYPAGTAGADLKAGALVSRFVSIAAVYGITADDIADAASLGTDAWAALDKDKQALFVENFTEVIAPMAFEAVDDFEAVRGTFDDAGVGEEMASLVAAEGISENVQALYDVICSAAGYTETAE